MYIWTFSGYKQCFFFVVAIFFSEYDFFFLIVIFSDSFHHLKNLIAKVVI